MRTLPVTTRALVQRINRALAKDERVLKKCKESSQWYRDLGDYYVVDLNRNQIVDQKVDILDLARELKVIQSFEKLGD